MDRLEGSASLVSARERLAVVAAACFVLGFVLHGGQWSWPTLDRAAGTASVAADRSPARASGVDTANVIDTVRHHVSPAPGHPGVLEISDDDYRARFDPDGFVLGIGPDDLRISLRQVRRGSTPLPVDPGPWEGEANSVQRAVAPQVAEHVTARAGELEWDVVLAAPPAGHGDLRVEASITGTTAARRLPGAWRFTLPTGTTVRMGEVVVIDATGAELHRALPLMEGERLVLEVPAAVLAGAAYPVTLDPTLGPEHPASTPPAPSSQVEPAQASDGTNHLVVWQDHRSSSQPDLYGARVSASGAVLDPAGIAISTAPGNQYAAAVAFDGANFLVVWNDDRSLNSNIMGARVSTSGTLLDGPPATGGLLISSAPSSQTDPAVASDGTNSFVVWRDFRSGGFPDIFGARVTTSGTVLDGPPATGGIAISTATRHQAAPNVVFGGTSYFVVWEDSRSGSSFDIFGARVTTGGALLDGSPVSGALAFSTAPNDQRAPVVAFDGTNYLLVWQDHRSGSTSDIFGTRVSTIGAALDGPHPTGGIAISTAPSHQFAPAVAFGGSRFLVAWQDPRLGPTGDIFGTRVSTAGAVLDGPPATGGIAMSTATGEQSRPAVSFDGTNHLVGWGDARSGFQTLDVVGTRVSTGGTVVDGPPATGGIVLSTGPSSQFNPVVAFDGTNHLVVWEDRRNGSSNDIFGARVSSTGVPLEPAGFPISSAAGDQGISAVAFDGTNFLVVWHDFRAGVSGDIYGARVSTAGAVLDPTGIAISTATANQTFPAVAFDGANYLVVWQDVRSGDNNIMGARVSKAGTLLDGPSATGGIAISTAAAAQIQPAVAFDGTRYFVVWQDSRSASGFDVFGAHVSKAGAVLDGSAATGGIAVSVATGDQSTPAVAFDGTRYLVVWQDARSGVNDIFGARVTTAGALLDGNPLTGGLAISTASGSQQTPAVAANGPFLVVWRDRRSATFDVYGARVAGDGTVTDPAGIAIATSPSNEGLPTVIGAPGNKWTVSYDRIDTSFGTPRAYVRTVSPK